MIKYRLKEQGIDVVDTVLTNRRLTSQEVKEILDANNSSVESGLNYKNMDVAIDLLLDSISKNLKIATLVDNDADGMASSGILYNFIKEVLKYDNIEYILHKENKTHGLTSHVMKEVKKREIGLLITPDSSSSDVEQQQKLIDMGVGFIALDHHEFDSSIIPKGAIVVNNQDGKAKNKNLSGAGVTYKFVTEVYKKLYHKDMGVRYLDLVAVSIIADVMNMRELENRYYLNIGSQVENVKNQFLKRLIEVKKLEDTLTIEDIGFSLSPLINATIRVGTVKDKELIFRAISNIKENIESKKRGETGKLVPIENEAVRIATNLKSKQDKNRDKSMQEVLSSIEFDKISNDKVFVCDVTDTVDKSMTGLVANKLLDKVNKPIILVKHNEKTSEMSGSARGLTESIEIPSFKDVCVRTGKFTLAQGHPNAMGVSFKKDDMEDVKSSINNILKDVDIFTGYSVDGVYEGAVPLAHVKAIAEYEKLWCNNIKAPLFVVKNVRMNTEDIEKVGNATYKFDIGSVRFTKNYGSKVWYQSVIQSEELPFGGDIIADIVCKFRKNKKGFYWCDIVDMVTKEDDEEVVEF